MAEPSLVQLKRKRTEEPVDYLYLEGEGDAAPQRRYVRANKKHKSESQEAEAGEETSPPKGPLDQGRAADSKPQTTKRVFELQRKPASISRKRKGGEEDIATFVEKRQKSRTQTVTSRTEQSILEADSTPTAPLKRPGNGSALRTPTKPTPQAETDVERKQMEALAAYMHEAALDELKREQRLKPVSAPKLSGARSREIHRQRAATNGSVSAMELDDEDSYVYDTYILAPTTDLGAIRADELGQMDSVGYLVITEDDRSLWETYLEEEPSDKDWNSDEDDENAEGYYAADYPDDEAFSGSEDGCDGRVNDEEWDEDTGAYSDDEEVALRRGEVPRRFRQFGMGLGMIER